MFEQLMNTKINLKLLDDELIEKNDDGNIDHHQTILNIGYAWWNKQPNPDRVSYHEMINFMDNTYGTIYGTLILIGKYNQQVSNNGHIGYYENHYSRAYEKDYDQSLHQRMVIELEKISEICTEQREALEDFADVIYIDMVIGIMKEYLDIGIELEEEFMEEVECGSEAEGIFYEMVPTENPDYGRITDSRALDKLDNQYYKMDTNFMKAIETIAAKCFKIEQVDTTTLALNSDAIIIEDDVIDEEREEWDDEMTISDRIDAMVDPEMNIFKVREMFQEAYDLGNTKSESEYLIEQFVKNFDKEYFIVKRG